MHAGSDRVRFDVIDPWPARAMRGLLDQDPDAFRVGDRLPLGWHWLYFREPLPASSLGPDGHEARGAFMPTGDLPRRMWAGGSLHAIRPVIVGEAAELRSRLESVVEKTGRSGRLAFATVHQELWQGNHRCVKEEQRIVYCEAQPPASPCTPAPARDREQLAWEDAFLPTEVALFRFSALTYNAHRIHYDRAYAEAEGYPDLLVHAPLTVLALLDAAERRWGAAGAFKYRARAPLYANQPIRLVGRETPEGPSGPSRAPSGPSKVAEAVGPDGTAKLAGQFSTTPRSAS